MRSLESCFDTTCLFNRHVAASINLIKPASTGANVTMSADMAIKALETSLGKIVLIKLKGGKVIRGSLQGFDQHMNLSLEAAEEIVADGKSTSMGTLIVRGDNIIMISPPPG
jgi:small nuclear ribonucleoprotein